MTLSYPALSISGDRESLELALAVLVDHGCLGAEETAEGRLTVFFPTEADARAALGRLDALESVGARELPPVVQRDWLAEWKASFTGFTLGERFFVLPTWKPVPAIERSILSLDPEQAFGTGTHDTTRLAAEILERLVRPGDSVIDLGAGTGLLAMIAARLGAVPVTAIEPDRYAAACARENVVRNELEGKVRVEVAAVEDYEALRADLVVANITAPVLERALERVRAGRVVLSGILVEQVDDFVEELPARFAVRERWSAGDWAALVLRAAE